MPYAFHEDRNLYFMHQTLTTEKYIIPFIQKQFPINAGKTVLEIGCAEAGVLKAFLDRGCLATGVELAGSKLDTARQLLPDEIQSGRLVLINKNIYEEEFKQQFRGQFDLIVLKDVIEHIPDQQKLLAYLMTFLKPGGVIFFAFPPWYMPFGGHQQMCRNKILSVLPWFHILPAFMYRAILKLFGESAATIEGLLANKRTGISIERFERILDKTGYQILSRKFYLLNPIYEFKFKLKPKEQFSMIAALPYLRDLFTTGVYYLVSLPEKS
jgi:2-polyprenyl-3-methyl-5-hydroxy-6-metoxy-1,4-benzoquinol methylase